MAAILKIGKEYFDKLERCDFKTHFISLLFLLLLLLAMVAEITPSYLKILSGFFLSGFALLLSASKQ